MSLSEKLSTLTEQAKQISTEMSMINRQREKYKGCVIVYKVKASKHQPEIGLINDIDFVNGYLYVRTAFHEKAVQIYLNMIDYEIIAREDLVSHLKL